MANNPIGWFEIYVDDMQRAKNFYQSVLKVELESLSNPTEDSLTMWAFPSNMETYGASGALVHHDSVKAGGMSTIVYFHCEDCALEESRVEAAGGKVENGKMSIGQYGFCSLVRDTEGNMIGLHSMK
ncbi:VOC family protein [Kangiella sp. TOML190]|uniref:VOC family protein n=1 Tax=Kangiella sp. TOML190 TaxID=2931351 RepID=UPI0020410A45|nr:VOC family protein [Kangiella sp. TOML190]